MSSACGSLELDAIDTALLRHLQEDGRASLRTLAKRIGVSVPTVSARLKNLERLGIVRGYRAVLDAATLDETAFALVVETKPRAAEEVAGRIAGFPWARKVLTGRGGSVLVDATAVRPEDVPGILEAVSALPGVVDVRDFGQLRTVKDEPSAILTGRPTAKLTCYECRGPIQGKPVKVRRDGRHHYFCCTTCERLYLERYDRIRAASRTPK